MSSRCYPAMSYYIILQYSTLACIISNQIVSHRVVSCRSVLRCLNMYTMLFETRCRCGLADLAPHLTRHCTTLHCTTLHGATLPYTTLHYTTLYRVIACYSSSYYITLDRLPLPRGALLGTCSSSRGVQIYTCMCVYIYIYTYTYALYVYYYCY